jgi:hypothetical protein
MHLNANEIEKFSRWLKSCGAEILAHTSEWEIIRAKVKGETVVAYRNGAGKQTWPPPLMEFYKLRGCGHQPQLANPVKQLRGNRKGLINELASRDGWCCWYCASPLDADTATVEEICPRQIGGPVHIGNQCLACADCNREAGNMTVVAKVVMRERKRFGGR